TLASASWLLFKYPNSRGPSRGKRVEVEVPPGISARKLADELGRVGILRSPFLWTLYVRLVGADSRLRAGTVQLHDRLSPAGVLWKVIEDTSAPAVRVTIPEGFTRFEIAERLARLGVCEANEFLDATTNQNLLRRLRLTEPTVEGYLFPDTYELARRSDPATVVVRMGENWRRKASPVFYALRGEASKLKKSLGWGQGEVLTLASIVEKEAAVPEERPIIAGVFFNRLLSPDFSPKRLQADPTVVYGCLVARDQVPSCE